MRMKYFVALTIGYVTVALYEYDQTPEGEVAALERCKQDLSKRERVAYLEEFNHGFGGELVRPDKKVEVFCAVACGVMPDATRTLQRGNHIWN